MNSFILFFFLLSGILSDEQRQINPLNTDKLPRVVSYVHFVTCIKGGGGAISGTPESSGLGY